jgi:hypothetical protein
MHEPQASLIFRIATPSGLRRRLHRAARQLDSQEEKLSLYVWKTIVNSKPTFAKVGQKSSVLVRVYPQRRTRDKPRVLSAVGKQMTSPQRAGVPNSMVDSPVLSNWRFKVRLLKGITAKMKARTDAEDTALFAFSVSTTLFRHYNNADSVPRPQRGSVRPCVARIFEKIALSKYGYLSYEIHHFVKFLLRIEMVAVPDKEHIRTLPSGVLITASKNMVIRLRASRGR